MKLLPLFAPVALALLLASPSAEAQRPGLSLRYHGASAGGHVSAHLRIGGGAHGTARSSGRAYSSYRRGAPTWVRRAPTPRRVWIPGHYEIVQRKVWIPGSTHRVWVPPAHETRYDWCGRPYTVIVSPGHYQTVQSPGRWECRDEQVWCPPHWEVRS